MIKKNKFKVAPKEQRTLNGKVYASKKEMTYAIKLNSLKKAKRKEDRVVSVEEQVKFSLDVNGCHICNYILDFKVYYGDGRIEHIDVKGYTKGTIYRLFKMKSKLMEAIYGIDVIEV